MKYSKKFMSFILSFCMLISLMLPFIGCKSENNEEKGRVYYLNFKPEQDKDWQNLAKKYTEKTGVKVTVLTASDNQYENTLATEMDKTEAPTLFQVNGVIGLEKWKEDCYNLSNTELYRQLTSDEFALKKGNEVLGIAYAIETYGIIYNKNLLNKYFECSWSTIKKVTDIKDFKSLKTVTTEIQSHKKDLNIDGAFTSPGMDSSSDWRFKTHLANMPIYYEYKADNISFTKEIKGSYLDNFKMIWDLYINNATCDKSQIATKTGNDALSEFVTGKAVFYQNGTWAYKDIINSGKIKAEDIGMLPIYIGTENDNIQGLCTGSENYWCINKNVKKEDIKATLDFLDWVITSEEGTKAMANEMGFVSPFKKAKETSNVLSKIANDYIAAGKKPVSWVFPTIPSEEWKNGLGAAMTGYAQGKNDWETVKTAFVSGWKNEANKTGK